MGIWPVIWYAGISLLFISLFPIGTHYLYAKRSARSFTGPEASEHRPHITVLLPMRNESANVVRKIDEVASMEYPKDNIKILLIDSGSDDGTAALAEEHLDLLSPGISWEVHKIERPGKSVAVNAALDVIETKYFVMMDADSICPEHSLSRLMDWFVDPQVGAVCGQLDVAAKGGDPYRFRFNSLRLGESVMDSTPIFEGSICSFRTEAIGECRIDPRINADDSQMAMISRSNGFRAVMDPEIRFSEVTESISRPRRLRRAQGLSRALFSMRGLCMGMGRYSRIMRKTFFFHIFLPWLVISSIICLISPLISPLVLTSSTPTGWQTLVSIIIFLFLVSTRIGRSFLEGVLILAEAHLKILLGQTMEVWDTQRD